MRRRDETTVVETFDNIRSDYEAAKVSRLRRIRTGLGGSGDAQLGSGMDLWTVREYARDMDRNDGVVGQAVTRACDNILRTGLSLDPDTGDEQLNKDLASTGSKTKIVIDGVRNDSWSTHKQKFLMASDAHQAPDIYLTGHEDIGSLAEAGYIIPLDDFIAQYQDTYDDIFESLWKPMTYKGKVWAIPQDTESRPMFFSKMLLRDLGWSEEKIDDLPNQVINGEFTLDDMLALAKEGQDKGIIKEGYGFWTRPKQGPDWYSFWINFGGELEDPATGKLVFVKDAGEKVLNFWYKTMYELGTTTPDNIGTDWKIWHETVAAGQNVLFWNAGTWHWMDESVNYVAEQGGEDFMWENEGFALIPSYKKGGRPSNLSHPLIYTISTDSKYKDIAFRLITIASSVELNTLHAVGSSHLGIRKSQVEYPPYANNKFLHDAAYMVGYASYLPNNPNWAAYDNIVWLGTSAVLAGEMKPAEALDMIVEELQTELGDEVIIK